MQGRIYLTHCSAKKDLSYRDSGQPATPDRLYTSREIQAFVHRCNAVGVPWAIFSDRYGIYFPTDEHVWYEQDPSKVSPDQFKALVADFDAKLQPFQEIWFYQNPSHFHPMYRKLLESSRLKPRIRLFSRIREISPDLRAARSGPTVPPARPV